MAFNTEEDRFCLVGHSFKLPFITGDARPRSLSRRSQLANGRKSGPGLRALATSR